MKLKLPPWHNNSQAYRLQRNGRTFQVWVTEGSVIAYEGTAASYESVFSAFTLEELEAQIDRNDRLTEKFGHMARYVCCEKAVVFRCVCTAAWECPEHAPEGKHIGTHD